MKIHFYFLKHGNLYRRASDTDESKLYRLKDYLIEENSNKTEADVKVMNESAKLIYGLKKGANVLYGSYFRSALDCVVLKRVQDKIWLTNKANGATIGPIEPKDLILASIYPY